MTVGSLFTGVGGMDMGLEAAGMRVVWQVEIDPQARAVLRRHWPEVALHEDVRQVGRHNLEPVDIICGGFPCQDISVAGRRAGLAGERSGLWWEFHRIIAELAPRWVLIENVPGLLSSNGGRDMGAILGALADLGYGYAYRVLDLRHFGPPQRRRRVFIVGRAGGFCPPEVLLEPESVCWDSAAREEAWTAIAGDALPRIAGTLEGASDWRRMTGHEEAGDETQTIIAYQCHGSDVGPTVAHTLRATWDGSEDGTGRGVPIVAFHHTPRRLTPRECERLMGWPDDWTRWGVTEDGREIELADAPRYRMCGNGVGAPVAEWIGRRIMAVDATACRSSVMRSVEDAIHALREAGAPIE